MFSDKEIYEALVKTVGTLLAIALMVCIIVVPMIHFTSDSTKQDYLDKCYIKSFTKIDNIKAHCENEWLAFRVLRRQQTK